MTAHVRPSPRRRVLTGETLRRLGRAGWRYATRHPFSVIVAVVVLVSGAVFTAPRTPLVELLAAGPHTTAERHLWWTPLTALLVPGSLLDALLTAALAVTVLAYVERILGTARTVLTYVGVGVVAIWTGIGIHMLTIMLGTPVFLLAVPGHTLDPATGMFGAIMTGSAFAPVLFRRRIRIVGFAVALTFALYGGDQDSMYRLLAAVLGLLLGMVLRGRAPQAASPAFVRTRSSYAEVRTLVAAVVAVTGIGPVIVLLERTVNAPLALVVSGYAGIDRSEAFERCAGYFTADCDGSAIRVLAHGVPATLLSLVPVMLSLIAAWGLHAGRRAAWVLAVVVNAVDLVVTAAAVGILGLLSVAGVERAGERFTLAAMLAVGVPVAVLVALLLTRARFLVRVGRDAVHAFVVTTAVAAAVLVALWLVVYAITGSLRVPAGLRQIFLHILGVTLPPAIVHGISHATTHIGDVLRGVDAWVGVLFWAAVATAAVRLIRATDKREFGDSARYRALLREVGGGTLSYMGTWEGNEHWINPDGTGGVAYRRVGSVALVVADPVCAAGQEETVIAGFLARCDEMAVTPAFYSIHARSLRVLRRRGWRGVSVGEETVVNVADLTLGGGRWKRVRQALAKAERLGLRTVWTRWADLGPSMIAQIEELSEHWVAEKALPELGFTLGGIEELRDPAVAVMLAVDAHDRLQAVTSWLPAWRDGVLTSWTLDFMRRGDDAMPEIMVYLIATAALHMRDAGVSVMSLSGAPLAVKPAADGTGRAAPASQLARLLTWLADVLEPVYGFRSLFEFKQKFHPELHTIHLAYADVADLPAIGGAIGRAYLPNASGRQTVDMLRMLSGGRV